MIKIKKNKLTDTRSTPPLYHLLGEEETVFIMFYLMVDRAVI